MMGVITGTRVTRLFRREVRLDAPSFGPGEARR